ncbi:hypothetical protein [Mesorhizobium sp.]|uniref:hypothetical protein n=1 Tax=Mesorhizobium sp. TaxID=1871066 RepID=UPI001204495B|nr:hypothetical protein [Mesorhizobium sp.]TIS36373.1 MAG: hypothetical protein E5W95_23375 [Mesorhizobium sp.]
MSTAPFPGVEIPTVEPLALVDTFVTSALPLQAIGDNMRLLLVVSGRSIHDKSPENSLVAKTCRQSIGHVENRSGDCSGRDTIRTDASATEVANAFLEFLDAPRWAALINRKSISTC